MPRPFAATSRKSKCRVLVVSCSESSATPSASSPSAISDGPGGRRVPRTKPSAGSTTRRAAACRSTRPHAAPGPEQAADDDRGDQQPNRRRPRSRGSEAATKRRQPSPPITSTPSGGRNSNAVSAMSGFTTTFSSSMRVIWFKPSTSSRRCGARAVEPDQYRREVRAGRLRLRASPNQTVALVGLDDVETVANAAVAGEQHRGARGDRFVERSDRDLASSTSYIKSCRPSATTRSSVGSR